ncbi:MAG: pirin family protein [Alphaproteobacteria bacterium]
MKKIDTIHKAAPQHWVGDGFPVRGMMGYQRDAEANSPFLLLDYAGPYEFAPTTARRGVGQHPHRGFETVTIVYDGEVSHKDSLGTADTIGPGDVQWMTAAGGILHEEYHSDAYAAKGGPFRMVQLWVNLPRKDKLVAPHYQAILAQDIPTVALPEDAGHLRVIAGAFTGAEGPAHTYSPINMWDVVLDANAEVTLDIPTGHTTLVAVLEGDVTTPDGHKITEAELARFGRDGTAITLATTTGAKLLVLTGEPLNEPVYGYGPFVMTNEQEIKDAIADLRLGRFEPAQAAQPSSP